MTRFLIIFCAVLFLQNNEATITWNASYKLTWEDFKGSIDQTKDAIAVTASGITFGYSMQKTDGKIISFNTQVFAHFYPDKSWVKLDKADNHILAHEQLHFDITELHVRKFKQKIANLEISQTLEKKLDILHKEANKAVAEMQNSYDSESDNSRNREEQTKWQSFVSMELQKLVNFKS